MFLLLLLSVCAAEDLSFNTYEETYGSTHRIHLPRNAESIEFHPQYKSGRNVLWKRDGSQTDSRGKAIGSYYVMRKVTQEDNGRYLIKDKNRAILDWHILEVKERTVKYWKRNGDGLFIYSNLEGIHCNIFFYAGNGTESQTVVYQSELLNLPFCKGLMYENPCTVSSTYLEKTCTGRFEFRDDDENKAVVMYLEIEPLFYEKPQFGASIAALILSIISGCLKFCCCGKSSSKKHHPDTPDDDEPADNSEPAVFYNDSHHEPVGPRTEPNPAQPSVPLIHSPPNTGPRAEPASESSGTVNPDQSSVPLIPPSAEPPSYSEVTSPDGAQTFPLSSGPELRFEVKGMTFDPVPPLSSDTAEPSVYSSEKLNFL